MKFRNSIEIAKPEDWEAVAADVIDDFLEDFPKRKGLTRKPNDDDQDNFDGLATYIYTQKGMNLYDRLVNRLNELGSKIFPDEEFNYYPNRMIMP